MKKTFKGCCQLLLIAVALGTCALDLKSARLATNWILNLIFCLSRGSIVGDMLALSDLRSLGTASVAEVPLGCVFRHTPPREAHGTFFRSL